MDFLQWEGWGGEVHFNQIKLLIKNNNNNNKIPFNCFQPTGEFGALDHAGEIYPSQNEASSTDLPLELMLKAKINSGKLISKKNPCLCRRESCSSCILHARGCQPHPAQGGAKMRQTPQKRAGNSSSAPPCSSGSLVMSRSLKLL